MSSSAALVPIQKNVVLVGAGNAHVVFVKRWSMKPIPGIAVTLVNESGSVPYSAMVPAYLGGDYAWNEITIDLVRLCQSAGVRFVRERVTKIDPVAHRVFLSDRPPLMYDALGLGLGSIPANPSQTPASSFVMRPLATLLDRLAELDKCLTTEPKPYHFVVVGGGASGCELALAIHKRLGRHAGFRLTLLQGNERLMPHFPAGVARHFERAFAERGIAFRVNAQVARHNDRGVSLIDGAVIECDGVLWATQAAPPTLLFDAGLPVDGGGFLKVRETLQSVDDSAVFGTGDCVAFEAYPTLPRNGVHAVRQGTVLFDNIGSFLMEKPLRPFKPQRFTLCLLNSADGEAILSYGSAYWKSRGARRLKDRIDRAWIAKFIPPPPPANVDPDQAESALMRCGGCGSKIAGDVLSAVLKRLDLPDDPRIIMGCRAGEDAAVHRVHPELYGTDPANLVEVQTVDYFKAFVDDPYIFGQIAALHAVSDLYAMNARPFSALAIATLPYARGPIQEAQLYELLSGAVTVFKKLGVVLTGGHTTEGQEMALGFSVTGFGEENKLFRKGALKPGDHLILTKPLGSGAIMAAWMRGMCQAPWYESLLTSMLTPNAAAGAIFARAGVTACTDITGFGLAGHLFEMLGASSVSLRVNAAAVPVSPGFHEIVAFGIVSTLQRDNAKIACRIDGPSPLPAWLFDPQTSGGLLAGVKSEAVDATLQALHAAGYPNAAVIGDVVASGGKSELSLRIET